MHQTHQSSAAPLRGNFVRRSYWFIDSQALFLVLQLAVHMEKMTPRHATPGLWASISQNYSPGKEKKKNSCLL